MEALPLDASVADSGEVNSDASGPDAGTSLCASLAPLTDDFSFEKAHWVRKTQLSEISFGSEGLQFASEPMASSSLAYLRSAFTQDSRNSGFTVKLGEESSPSFYIALDSFGIGGGVTRAKIQRMGINFHFTLSYNGMVQSTMTKVANPEHKIWRIRHGISSTGNSTLYFTTGATEDTLDNEQSTTTPGTYHPEAVRAELGYSGVPGTTNAIVKGINLSGPVSPYCLAESLRLSDPLELSAHWRWTSGAAGNAELVSGRLLLQYTNSTNKLINNRGVILQDSSLSVHVVRGPLDLQGAPFTIGLERDGVSVIEFVVEPSKVSAKTNIGTITSEAVLSNTSPTGFKLESSDTNLSFWLFEEGQWNMKLEKTIQAPLEALSLFIRHKDDLLITAINTEP